MWLPPPEERKRLYQICGVSLVLIAAAFFFVFRPAHQRIPDADAQMNEVNQLAQSKDLEGLKQAAGNRKYNERAAARAVQAYAQSSGSAGAPAMRTFFNDQRPYVRAEAARGWVQVSSGRDRASLKPILDMSLTDVSPQVRIAGLQALASIKAWDSLPGVCDRMLDDDESVRRTAMATFEKVSFLRVENYYKPENPPQVSKPTVARLREFAMSPVARGMYVTYLKQKGWDQ